jgi:hypothetical protein
MATVPRSTTATIRTYTKPIRPLSPVSSVDDGALERSEDGRLWIAKTIQTRNGHSRRNWILVREADYEFITNEDVSDHTTPNPSSMDTVWDMVQGTTVWIARKAGSVQEATTPHISAASDKVAFHGYTAVKNIGQWYAGLGYTTHDEFEMVEHPSNDSVKSEV